MTAPATPAADDFGARLLNALAWLAGDDDAPGPEVQTVTLDSEGDR